jgi:hypothetical protein
MSKTFKISLLLIFLFSLNACTYSMSKLLPERPADKFAKDLESASPEFQQGWRDGCEVGMSAGSNTFYKMFYRNNVVDGYKMTSSSEYKTAWGNSFWYCYRADYVKQINTSIWSSMFGGYR